MATRRETRTERMSRLFSPLWHLYHQSTSTHRAARPEFFRAVDRLYWNMATKAPATNPLSHKQLDTIESDMRAAHIIG